eukprot:TRINITY_DN2843_c1_g1_i5.p1 TRINITY_DN2843_c1_g1~~TRINITY_DN2843_c1_g1_i5.p1  ORF type:complete len:401 (+),score=106.21 TRINITY_DN2843_c1_g1_i5:74-1276(+)
MHSSCRVQSELRRHKMLAINSKFNDKPSISAMFVSSLANGTLDNHNRLDTSTILKQLEQMILNPSKVYPIIQALTKSGLAREEVTAAVVYIYCNNDKMEDLIQYTVNKEIGNAKNETDLFKEDSVLVSIYINYTKLIGLQYLWRLLADTLYDVSEVQSRTFSSSHHKEEDDDKFMDVLHLKLAAQAVFNRMKTTPFPFLLKMFLLTIKTDIDEEYSHLSNSVLATFVLLRFICLAITNPKLYGLWKKNPNEKTLRCIVLLSKIIQNTAFGVEFNKEDELVEVNDYIRVNSGPMSKWVENICVEEMREEGEEREYVEVEVGDGVKENGVKWMWSVMRMNRQVMRRELNRKMDGEEWKEMKKDLEDMGVLTVGGTSSESLSSRVGDKSRSSEKSLTEDSTAS